MFTLPLLSQEEISWCKTKVGAPNQLAFGLMIAYFRSFVMFPSEEDTDSIQHLVAMVGASLKLENTTSLEFQWSGRTAKRFRKEIREHFGYQEPSNEEGEKLMHHLVENVLTQCPSKVFLNEQVREYFKSRQIESLKPPQLKRYIAAAQRQFEESFFKTIFDSLNKNDREHIDQVLNATNNVILVDLKKAIPGARLKHIDRAIQLICFLQKLSLKADLFKAVNRKLLLKYYDRIMVLSPSEITKYTTTAKYAMMAIFFYVRLQLHLDDLTDTFIKLIHRMRTKAENYVDKNILKDVKRVDGKFDILEKLARITVDHPHDIIKDSVYPRVSRELLCDLLQDLGQRGKWYQTQVRSKIYSNYVHGSRSTLLDLLCLFEFKEEHATYSPILDAISLIKKQSVDGWEIETLPVKGVIPDTWHSLVVTQTSQGVSINKYYYEIAVLEELKILLGFKAIWINGAYRFRNPHEESQGILMRGESIITICWGFLFIQNNLLLHLRGN